MMLPKEATLEAFRMMADFNKGYLQGPDRRRGGGVFRHRTGGADASTICFPNFSPWGGWARIVYRFRPNGNNPDEAIFDTMLLAPWPKDRPKPPAAKLQMLEPDQHWVECEDLGTLARIFDQDTANVTQVHKGLQDQEPAARHLRRLSGIDHPRLPRSV